MSTPIPTTVEAYLHSVRALSTSRLEGREALVGPNLPFVVRVAREYQGRGLPLEDLLMEGTIGLLEAADRFDPSRGVRFLTYAVWWIRRAMLAAVARSTRQVRLPRYRCHRFRQARQEWDALRRDGRSDAGTGHEELARRLGTTPDEAATLLRSYPAEVRLEDPAGGRSVRLQVATDPEVSPERRLLSQEVDERLRSALESLPPRERLVLAARFGLDGETARTLREVGAALGLTKERVRQIEVRGLRRLRVGLAPSPAPTPLRPA